MAACIMPASILIGLVKSRRRSPMFPALALTGGHLLWFLAGLAAVALTVGAEGILSDPFGLPLNAAVFAVFFLWLLVRPGVVSGMANIALSALFVYQGLISISGDWASPEVVNAVTLHAVLYAATIIALGYGMVKVWWERGS